MWTITFIKIYTATRFTNSSISSITLHINSCLRFYKSCNNNLKFKESTVCLKWRNISFLLLSLLSVITRERHVIKLLEFNQFSLLINSKQTCLYDTDNAFRSHNRLFVLVLAGRGRCALCSESGWSRQVTCLFMSRSSAYYSTSHLNRIYLVLLPLLLNMLLWTTHSSSSSHPLINYNFSWHHKIDHEVPHLSLLV